MIAVLNRSLVKEGAVGGVVERFATSRGNVQGFPGFVSTEVLASEEAGEVLPITRWQSREAFGYWIKSQEFEKAHGRGGGELLRGAPRDGTLRGRCRA